MLRDRGVRRKPALKAAQFAGRKNERISGAERVNLIRRGRRIDVFIVAGPVEHPDIVSGLHLEGRRYDDPGIRSTKLDIVPILRKLERIGYG